MAIFSEIAKLKVSSCPFLVYFRGIVYICISSFIGEGYMKSFMAWFLRNVLHYRSDVVMVNLSRSFPQKS